MKDDDPKKDSKGRKPSINLTLDEDVIEILRKEFPREGSKMVSNLTREFRDAVEKEPELLYHLKHREIGYYVKKRKTEKP